MAAQKYKPDSSRHLTKNGGELYNISPFRFAACRGSSVGRAPRSIGGVPSSLEAMFWVYILKSSEDGGYYIGQCADLASRLERHQKGYVPSTRTRGPWELVHREGFESRGEAVLRERFLKALKSKKAIKQVVEVCRGSSVGRAQD